MQGVLKFIEIVHAFNIALEAERVEAPAGGEPRSCVVFGEEPGNHLVLCAHTVGAAFHLFMCSGWLNAHIRLVWVRGEPTHLAVLEVVLLNSCE